MGEGLCVCVYTCVHDYGGQRSACVFIPQKPSALLFEAESLIGWNPLIRPGWLATEHEGPPAPLSLQH